MNWPLTPEGINIFPMYYLLPSKVGGAADCKALSKEHSWGLCTARYLYMRDDPM